MENNENIIIDVNNLIKSYGFKKVLKGISFQIERGEIFGILGKNGVGKSTTIECLLGAKSFNSGDIYINGYNIKKDPIKIKKEIGYVASEPTCYKEMTGISYLELIASIHNVKPQSFLQNIDFLLKALDFKEEDLYRQIIEYSHGMQQKLCLMASLIHNPSIWVLDEPTVGLDSMTANNLSYLIKDFSKHNNTCIITSHNIDLVAKLCDKVIIIKDGLIYNTYNLRKEPQLRSRLSKIFLNLNKEWF